MDDVIDDLKHLLIFYVVPNPTVAVAMLNPQELGQPITLECNVSAVRGITSRVDIVWKKDNAYLTTIQGLNASFWSNNLAFYVDTYQIPQLNTSDDDTVYQCEVVINTSPPVMATDAVMFSLTGKYS